MEDFLPLFTWDNATWSRSSTQKSKHPHPGTQILSQGWGQQWWSNAPHMPGVPSSGFTLINALTNILIYNWTLICDQNQIIHCMPVKSKCKNKNKNKSNQSAWSPYSARSAVCSLHDLPFGVTGSMKGRSSIYNEKHPPCYFYACSRDHQVCCRVKTKEKYTHFPFLLHSPERRGKIQQKHVYLKIIQLQSSFWS